MANRVVTFDLGKTGCRAAVYDGGRRCGEVERAGSPSLADPAAVAAAAAALTGAADQLAARDVDVVVAGIAGLGRGMQHAEALVEALTERFRGARFVLTSDMVTAHAGALGGRAGVVVAAGTGSVALAIDTAGRSATADGWGYLLGDGGSGYDIGRAGLAAALRHHDGRGGSPELCRRALARFGALDELPGSVHGAQNPAQVIASFAVDVLAAARADDLTAAEIWRSAASTLARTAAAAARRVFPDRTDVPVATAGGLFGAGALLTDAFSACLTRLLPHARLVPAIGDGLAGAALLARAGHGPHERLLRRIPPPAAPGQHHDRKTEDQP